MRVFVNDGEIITKDLLSKTEEGKSELSSFANCLGQLSSVFVHERPARSERQECRNYDHQFFSHDSAGHVVVLDVDVPIGVEDCGGEEVMKDVQGSVDGKENGGVTVNGGGEVGHDLFCFLL